MLDRNVWDVTYGNPIVIQGLLAQKRGGDDDLDRCGINGSPVPRG